MSTWVEIRQHLQSKVLGWYSDGGGECLFPLDFFSQASIGIYVRLFTSDFKLQVELADSCFEKEKWVASFEIEARKIDVLTEVFNNVVLKTRLNQFLSDTYISRKG